MDAAHGTVKVIYIVKARSNQNTVMAKLKSISLNPVKMPRLKKTDIFGNWKLYCSIFYIRSCI